MIRLGYQFNLDLRRLLETRLLVQANSGGGKSYLLRKLLEQTHGKVQQIVLDMEGEFATLREKFDYILVGKGGDLDAQVDTASLLARKMLELKTSVIVDLYELKHDERIDFVKEFLDAMMNAPKHLWHPVLVVLDEAHVFAPETGKSEAMNSVRDIATRGRKRGFCLIPATQRLSKLHKDVAAECINKIIGRTGLDIDMKRAGDELGFTSKSLVNLRELEPGEFYGFGPAISKEPIVVKVDPVQTKHLKAGQRIRAVKPAPTHKIEQMLKKLTDLPEKAREELKSLDDYKARIRELEAKLKERVPVKVPKGEIKAAVAKAEARLRADMKRDLEAIRKKAIDSLERAFKQGLIFVRQDMDALVDEIKGLKLNVSDVEDSLKFGAQPGTTTGRFDGSKPTVSATPKSGTFTNLSASREQIWPEPAKKAQSSGDSSGFGRCEKAILAFLLTRPDQTFTRQQVAAMTGYSQSGSFSNSISKLNVAGFLRGERGLLQITDHPAKRTDAEALAESGGFSFSLQDWVRELGKCERSVYEILLANPDRDYSREEIAQMTGYNQSGSFSNSLSRLRTLGLIDPNSRGSVRFNPEMRQFLGGAA